MESPTSGTSGTSGASSVLERFSPATRAWFTGAFAAPTPAQEAAWSAISSGEHTLVVAPTGSGKTLSAFLWALDRLHARAAGVPPGKPADLRTPDTDPGTDPDADPDTDPMRACRVLYVSPLKALAVDVERNLRSPLVGIGQSARRLGLPVPHVRVGVRSGDTTPQERRDFARRPTDILITTPESLFLLLTSSAREALRGVETVIVDEIHAVAGTKRGAHLAVSLARLDELLTRPAQRIGLSATVRPVEAVADFLAGRQPVRVVQPPSTKTWELSVQVPVPDLGELGGAPGVAYAPDPGLDSGFEPGSGTGFDAGLDGGSGVEEPWAPAADPTQRASIWPHVEERVLDLVTAHRSTLVFVNSRRLAERLTARLNELWQERLAAAETGATDADEGREPDDPVSSPGGEAGSVFAGNWRPSSAPPAQMLASGVSHGASPVISRAHHGSVSKEARAVIEDELKSGRLPAVVATSSLELGIDMGAVDLVVQVESPPTVSSALQRVGRAGHQVGATSRGVFFPKFRGDLVQTAVVVERMRAGQIEQLHTPVNPLDVLAQQVVAMCAQDDWAIDDLLTLLHRTSPYAKLTRAVLESVLDMLAGRYPSEEFAELRPRIVWDRATDVLSGRPGALRLAVTSGGTIPDRGLFGVFLAGGGGAGRRVGELDEEMVYESRVGDVFTLGTSSWRVEEITHDRVLVTPAPGAPGRLPFWRGDGIGRGSELGGAVGGFVRELATASDEVARARLTDAGLDEWAADNLLSYLREQADSTGGVPDDRHLVLERFRDELGDWRVVLHSPYGAQVHAPWALIIGARLRERFDVDVQIMHGDDGIVLSLPDIDIDDRGEHEWAAQLAEAILPPADEVTELVTGQVSGSALFASRFRECAARSLLLPRRDPRRRQALWQQRQRAMHLLQVASRYPQFPVVLEAVRECIQDVYDVPGLRALLGDIEAGRVQVSHVQTPSASPFARSLMFGYVAQFLYEGDSPLAERRAAALALDPGLLAELLGTDGALVRDLLDPQAVLDVEAELQHLTDERRCRGAEDITDMLRRLGPLTTAEITARTRPESASQVEGWLVELERSRRLIGVRIGGRPMWAVIEDSGWLRDALGVALPVGIPEAFLDVRDNPVAALLARFAAGRGPFTPATAAARFDLPEGVARTAIAGLVASGRLVEGPLRPLELRGPDEHGDDVCDAGVLRRLKRRSLAGLRAELEPVSPRDLAVFLPRWQSMPGRLRGYDGLLQAVEQLAGARMPASALESLVLPARVADYTPQLLDEAMSSGEVCWQAHGSIPGGDLWVSLHPVATAELTLSLGPSDGAEAVAPHEAMSPDAATAHAALLDLLQDGAGYFADTLERLVRQAAPGSSVDIETLLWDLALRGQIGTDSYAAVRARLGGGGAHRRRRPPPRGRRFGSRTGTGLGSLGSLGAMNAVGTATAPVERGRAARTGTTAGRWSLLPEPVTEPTARAVAAAELLLARHGVVTRGAAVAEEIDGGFAAIYRVLARAEESGRVRRGYLVEGLGASQFAPPAAIDLLRSLGSGHRSRHSGSDTASGVGDDVDAGSGARLGAGSDVRAGAGSGARPGAAVGARVGSGPATPGDGPDTLLLAATDPANPYGAALPWPQPLSEAETGHRPGRKAGALVVLHDGDLVLYLERGGRTLLTWSENPRVLAQAAGALAQAVHRGALGRLTVSRADGAQILGSTHPLVKALADAGFTMTPQGLRLRR
ncbi:Lhr family helicase [Piscicoccus intestinalis]|uniref:Lhr family helicase n=1 Tax=Piscicoccus intestinalis TaxID=746033 RepID=UPI000838E310|nr:DEAD/DEAH box helicase [Piscicoccus intestinalis]